MIGNNKATTDIYLETWHCLSDEMPIDKFIKVKILTIRYYNIRTIDIVGHFAIISFQLTVIFACWFVNISVEANSPIKYRNIKSKEFRRNLSDSWVYHVYISFWDSRAMTSTQFDAYSRNDASMLRIVNQPHPATSFPLSLCFTDYIPHFVSLCCLVRALTLLIKLC